MNIGPGERRKRRIAGGVGVLAAALWASLVLKGWIPPGWILLAALPLLAGLLGLLQGAAGT